MIRLTPLFQLVHMIKSDLFLFIVNVVILTKDSAHDKLGIRRYTNEKINNNQTNHKTDGY